MIYVDMHTMISGVKEMSELEFIGSEQGTDSSKNDDTEENPKAQLNDDQPSNFENSPKENEQSPSNSYSSQKRVSELSNITGSRSPYMESDFQEKISTKCIIKHQSKSRSLSKLSSSR